MARSAGMVQKLVFVWGVVPVLMATALPAQAQTGSVGGILRDASGGALPGVTVTLTDEKSGASNVAVNNLFNQEYYQSQFLFWDVFIKPSELRTVNATLSYRF